MEQLLVSGQPLLIFLEEPPGAQGPRLSALGQAWLAPVMQAVQVGAVPDAMLVPVAVTYDLVPDAPHDTHHVRPSCPLGPQVDVVSRQEAHHCILWPSAPQGWGGGTTEFCPDSHLPGGPAQATTVILFHPQKTPLGRDFSHFMDEKTSLERSCHVPVWAQQETKQRGVPQTSQLPQPPPLLQAAPLLGLWTGALAVLRSLRGWRGHRVCVRVHLAQPFSLQVWSLGRSWEGLRSVLGFLAAWPSEPLQG